MLLEAVERHVRIEQRILVIEPGNEADRQLSLGHGVDEATAELLQAERIAHCVDHRARRDSSGRDLPQLLQADGKLLRLPPGTQLQPAKQRLRQVAAYAVAEDGDLRVHVDAGLEGRLLLTVPADAAVTGTNADDAPAIQQHVLRGEAREEIDRFRLDLLRQPPGQGIERDEEVAVIAERRRNDRKRNLR